MRLSRFKIEKIKESFQETFQKDSIYLFGSRVDDNQKGGDIDLYIIPASHDNLINQKIDFLVKLKRKIAAKL